MNDTLTLSFIGYHWHASGDLFYVTRGDEQARVYVDSIGETWVDVRRIPEGGYFHSERVEAYRSLKPSWEILTDLRDEGFDELRNAHGAHRVRQRDI